MGVKNGAKTRFDRTAIGVAAWQQSIKERVVDVYLFQPIFPR